MSVLIKGMEMPESCMKCRLRKLWPQDYLTECNVDSELYSHCDNPTRHEDCPLVEVPAHGRLIDADALLVKIREYIDEYSDVDADGLHCEKWCAMKEAELVIIEAQTVLEADGGVLCSTE